MTELGEVMEEFCNQEKIYGNEGSTGVKNLCRLVHGMGYTLHFGQFHYKGSYGDLISFLEDNSGAIEAIKEWIAKQDTVEWKEELESNLPTKIEEIDLGE